LFTKHADGDTNADVDQLQRVAEGQNLDARLFLQKYERVLEAQRLDMRERREAVLLAPTEGTNRTRRITLETLDELWSDYLAATGELRSGTPWLSYAGKDPHASYIREIHDMFGQMTESIDEEVDARLASAPDDDGASRQRGATCT
jgi:preprotein translocase subunit SecA